MPTLDGSEERLDRAFEGVGAHSLCGNVPGDLDDGRADFSGLAGGDQDAGEEGLEDQREH